MKTYVMKCGGSTLKALSPTFFTTIVEFVSAGNLVAIVHGGGPEINAMLDKLSVSSTFINGLRQTTADVRDVAAMVLAGPVNQYVVAQLQANGGQALGINGASVLSGDYIDREQLGFVGQVTHVDVMPLIPLMESGYIPVISSLAKAKEDGETLNVNADTSAASVAEALFADELLFVTDVPGLLVNGEKVDHCTEVDIAGWIEDGTIYGGMIPKVKAALAALDVVDAVTICGESLTGTTISKVNIHC